MKQMSGSEIARIITEQEELEKPFTRMAVSNILKRAMRKMFVGFRRSNRDWNAFEVAVALSIGLKVDKSDLENFFKLFPPDIRRKIKEDASRSLRPSER